MAPGGGGKKIHARSARMIAAGFLLFGILLGIFDAPQLASWALERWKLEIVSTPFQSLASRFPYRLGLDIQGGTHLTYRADLKNISPDQHASSMEAVRNVIERRVNLFGVAEPLVQVERSRDEWRLIAELAGIRDIASAIRLIGQTPYLEFREEHPQEERAAILDAEKKGERQGEDPDFKPSELTGKYIKRADVDFGDSSFQPAISLELTAEGAEIFADLTRKNVGKRLAIYLDGAPISAPVVQEEITGGRAQITGNFTPASAKEFADRLNAGALPVPITLIGQQSVGASLGAESLARSLYAGMIGFLAVALFMVVWYRLPGLLAVLALVLYAELVLAIFKVIPVTVTIAGIAGFILSVGMAVDANILIFERMKEELRRGKNLENAIREGFGRAWTSIRDSNISSLITAAILYWLGTSVVKGFALTLGIGIAVSMFSAISVSRTLLLAVMTARTAKMKFLFLSGLSRGIRK